MENKYPKDTHKIQKLWDDITQLIGMELEILSRLDGLEKEIKILSKRFNDLSNIG